MIKRRKQAEDILIKKFGKENVEISWSENETYTDVFYKENENKFYCCSKKMFT
jgi:hypothetical protein